MSTNSRRSDDSTVADVPDSIVIDRSDPVERYRFVCPNGHVRWDKTNNHIWCRSCRRRYEAGEDVDAEHWAVLDKKTGERIPWSRVVCED